MKRLAVSIVGGITIPLLYGAIAGPLSTYIENDTLNHYLGYPVRWPILLLQRLFPIGIPDNEVGLFLFIIGCDVFLYTLLTYCFLLAFTKPKAPSDLPPPPVQ